MAGTTSHWSGKVQRSEISQFHQELASATTRWSAAANSPSSKSTLQPRIISKWQTGNRCSRFTRDRKPTTRKSTRSILELWSLRSGVRRSEEHTSELQSRQYLVCRLLLEKKKS